MRDDILNRRVPVPRNSLEDILAASERSAALERERAAGSERVAATVKDAGRRVSRKGEGDGWEALPAYAR